jgi:alkylated DNA repair dioxygenase AlkB
MITADLPFEPVDAPAFRFHEITGGRGIWIGRLPDELVPDEAGFEELWRLHPPEPGFLKIHGRIVQAPRWNQGFGHAYDFSGLSRPALPIPPALSRLLRWGQAVIDRRLNGVGVNWYDAGLGHYIGPHRDHREGLVPGAPLATIALGEERPFRVRPWKGRGYTDFAAPPGTVFVMPYATNLVATHEVPLLARHRGRRISVTMRAFRAPAPDRRA